jgi:hypothetical protein
VSIRIPYTVVNSQATEYGEVIVPKAKKEKPTGITTRPSQELLEFLRSEVDRRAEELRQDWTHAEILDEMWGAWKSLRQSTPNDSHSVNNLLIFPAGSQIIHLRPAETDLGEWAEKLIAIFRSGNMDAIGKIKRVLSALFRNLEGKHHVRVGEPERKGTPSQVGGAKVDR